MKVEYTYRTFCRLLLDNNYYLKRITGDHFIWYNEINKRTIIINKHPNKMVMKRLIKQNNLM